MKKYFLLCFSICIFFSCKKEDSNPNQILKNTDMETLSSSVQTWSNYGDGTGFIASWSNEVSFSPVYSLKISRTAIDTAKIWYWWQKYSGTIPVGRDLTLKAKIKGVNLSGNGAALVIRCDGAEPNLQFETTQGMVNINGTFDWSTYTLSLSNVKSNITSIFVFLLYLPKTTGTVYFDDVTLSYN
jgi:hypothetical protein